MGFSVRHFIPHLEHLEIKLECWPDFWKEQGICENLIRSVPFLPLFSSLDLGGTDGV